MTGNCRSWVCFIKKAFDDRRAVRKKIFKASHRLFTETKAFHCQLPIFLTHFYTLLYASLATAVDCVSQLIMKKKLANQLFSACLSMNN